MGQPGGDGSFLDDALSRSRKQPKDADPVKAALVGGDDIPQPADPADTSRAEPVVALLVDPDLEHAVEPADQARTGAGPASAPATRQLSPASIALIDEAMKKSALIWVRTPQSPAGRAVWHAWVGGRAYVVSGGEEQPDPGFGVERAVVVVRSKETTNRLLAFTAEVSAAGADDTDWALATSELAKARLNLRGAEDAPRRWQDRATYRVTRLTPVGSELVEGPGHYPADSGRAVPVATSATTAGPKPWVLHKRGDSGRRLS